MYVVEPLLADSRSHVVNCLYTGTYKRYGGVIRVAPDIHTLGVSWPTCAR